MCCSARRCNGGLALRVCFLRAPAGRRGAPEPGFLAGQGAAHRECGIALRHNGPGLHRDERAAAAPRAPGLGCARLPVQPVRASGALWGQSGGGVAGPAGGGLAPGAGSADGAPARLARRRSWLRRGGPPALLPAGVQVCLGVVREGQDPDDSSRNLSFAVRTFPLPLKPWVPASFPSRRRTLRTTRS